MLKITQPDAEPWSTVASAARLRSAGPLLLGVAAAYFMTARLGLGLAFEHTNATPVWPPSGIACAAVLLVGYRIWPSIWLGAFGANLVEYLAHPTPLSPVSVAAAACIATGNTLEALGAALLLRRIVGRAFPFATAPGALSFVVVALVACLLSSTIGSLGQALLGLLPWPVVPTVWLTWWLGDVAGILIVTPFLLSWARRVRVDWTPARVIETVLVGGLLLIAGQILFGGWLRSDLLTSLPYMIAPLLLWAAFRLSPQEAATAVVAVCGMAIVGTIHGGGPFHRGTLNESLLLLQAFVCVIASTNVALSAAVVERNAAMAALLAANITEREKVEEALRQSEARFRLAFSEVPIGMALAGPDGQLLEVNRALCQMLGYTGEELLELRYPVLTHPDDVAQSRELMRRLLAGEFPSAALEKRYLHRDGHVVWSQYTAALLRDASGQPLSFIYHLQDITARKDAEVALRASEERYRQVEQHAPIGLALVAPDGRWLRVNAALCALVGYGEDELLARTFQEITHPDDLDADLAYVRQMLAGEIATYQMEKRYVRKDGTLVWVLLAVSLVRDQGGQPVYFIAQIQDITARKQAEETLQEQADLLHLANDAIIVRDAQDVITFWSHGAERLYGWTTAEALGRVLPELLRTAFPVAREEVIAVLAREGLWTGEVVHTTRDGRRLAVESRQAVRRDAQGCPAVLLGIFNDITERRRVEDVVRRAEERYRGLLEAAPDAIVTCGVDGRIVLANAQAEQLFGYAREDLIGQSVDLLLPAHRQAAHVAHRARYMADPHTRPMGNGLDLFARTKGGGNVPVEVSLSPLESDGQTLVTAVIRDITVRQQAEAAIRSSEERLRTLIEHAPIGAAVADEHGIYEIVNDAYAGLYGYPREEMVGQPVTMLVPEEQRAALVDLYATLVARGADARDEYTVVTKSDERRTVLGQSVQFPGPDGRPRRATFTVDITERVRLEAELRASHAELARSNAELAQFASVASHDLRSPLNTIGGYAQLVQTRYRGKLDTNADEFLDFIVEAVKRMQLLMDDLLAYARLGAQVALPAPVDCGALVEQVIAQLGAAKAESGAVVTHQDLPTVWGRASQLGQVFQNLIGNALKFRGAESPRVHVAAERRDGHYLFTVQDNGIGLDPAQAERVFTLFRRLHTQEEYPGTGLGLAVCKKIVEQHGGRIWIEAQPGQGTRVLFTLPASPPPPR